MTDSPFNFASLSASPDNYAMKSGSPGFASFTPTGLSFDDQSMMDGLSDFGRFSGNKNENSDITADYGITGDVNNDNVKGRNSNDASANDNAINDGENNTNSDDIVNGTLNSGDDGNEGDKFGSIENDRSNEKRVQPLFAKAKSSQAKRSDIEEVIHSLRQRPGAISEGGIERLGHINGLEVFKEDFDGGKRISLGGRIILIDIDLMLPSNKVSKATLSLASAINDDIIAEQNARADAVLLANLQEPTLDKFADNLERVARLDKLSTKDIDNFQVVHGLYKNALSRIEKLERETLHMDPENDGYGIPKLNDEHALGLSIWYWRDHHRVSELDGKRYRIILEVHESDHAGGNWGVMQNNDWLGDLSSATSSDEHNWLSPDYSELEDQACAFVLRLDPPVEVPYYDAAILDPEEEVEVESLPTFDGSHDSVVYSERVIYDQDGNAVPQVYQFSLMSTRLAELRKIERVFIAHPRQIISVFQILRQSIRLQSLLDSVFNNSLEIEQPSNAYPIQNLSSLKSTSVSVTVTTPYGQSPQLKIIIPTSSEENGSRTQKLTSFSTKIERNGVVHIDKFIVNESINFPGKQDLQKRLERIINISEDIGITSHWLSMQIQ
ncbi:mediator of RNA polymerase II transcription subunit 1-domain-containing protein [Dipodascopsis uninucleata]